MASSRSEWNIFESLRHQANVGLDTHLETFVANLLGGYEEDLAKYNVTQQVTVTDFRQNEQAQGTITVKTKKLKSGYNSKHLKGVTFSDKALISVTSNGFENLNSIRAFVPRSFDIRISRDPVAILSIKARTRF